MKPGEGQVFSNGSWAWRVERLIELAADLPPEEVEVASFRELDFTVWEGAPTVREVVEHARRIMEADLSYPIIVSADGWIMDGCHRLAKAFMEGRETIKAVRFEKDPPPDEFIGM